MSLIVEFPVDYSKEDYVEYLTEINSSAGEENSDDGYHAWHAEQRDTDFDGFLCVLSDEIKKTKIKDGFLEIENGGWQNQHGMTLPFELSAQKVWEKVSGGNDVTVEIHKEGQKLRFKRFSHDEPTGADITLHNVKNYDKVKKSIWK